MNSIAIKKIGLEQLVPLQEIGRKTFYDTFFESDSEESMNAYLATSFSTEAFRFTNSWTVPWSTSCPLSIKKTLSAC